jgi:hypothetical protein
VHACEVAVEVTDAVRLLQMRQAVSAGLRTEDPRSKPY